MTVTASTGGSVTVTPALAAGNWVDSGTSRTIAAVPNAPAYAFLEWTGSGAGAYVGPLKNPPNIVINNPITQTANFVALNQPPAVTPGFAVIRGSYSSMTFTAASAATWTIRHTGGATFSEGMFEGNIYPNSATLSTSFTYQAPVAL